MEKLHELLGLSPNEIKILEYIIMAVTQTCQSWFRGWNIKAISANNKLQAHVAWQLYGLVWIVSLGLGLKAAATLDILGIFIFFFFSGVGLHISMLNKKE